MQIHTAAKESASHASKSFFGSQPAHASPFFSSSPVIQTKLTMGTSGDRFEREADAVADRVVQRMESGGISRGGTPPAQAKCEACRAEEDKLRRQAAPGNEDEMLRTKAEWPPAAVPDSVRHGLESGHSTGQALNPPLQQGMEEAFQSDFSGVRIHTGNSAESLNRNLSARAFTYGQNIFFNVGEFSLDTRDGRHLLAHELTHVVQQRSGQATVQREPKKDELPKPAVKTDVSIVLSDADQDMAEGRAYAKTVLRVTDAADAAAKLKALGAPVGKLFVVSHSNSAGQVEFSSSIGTVSWVPIADLAKALKGAATIDEVDFRGCKVGDAPGAMESFRKTVGAQSTRGSNCWTFVQRVMPLTLEGVPVTSRRQIPKGQKTEFDEHLLNEQLAGMTSADGKPVQNCLIGLAKGEKANDKTLGKIWKLYWANNGNLVASWASPDNNKNWQEGSICSKDMTADTKPCAVVEVKAPSATTPAGGGKTSALGEIQDVDVSGVPSRDFGPQSEEMV